MDKDKQDGYIEEYRWDDDVEDYVLVSRRAVVSDEEGDNKADGSVLFV